MAGRGPAPKNPATRQRRNRTTTAAQIEPGSRRAGGVPPLPKRAGGWHPRTSAWWRKLWGGELGTRMLDVDFYPLLRIAELWEDYHRADAPSQRLELARELRLQESRWPLDEMARRSLQIDVPRAPAGAPKAAPSAFPDEEPVDPRLTLRAVK